MYSSKTRIDACFLLYEHLFFIVAIISSEFVITCKLKDALTLFTHCHYGLNHSAAILSPIDKSKYVQLY